MCGRFNVIDNPGLQQLLRDLGIDLKLPTRPHIAPTDRVGLVRRLEAGNQLDHARWWLTPSWAPAVDQKYSMFNARSETLASSRAFGMPFKRQRGLVPMSSFIEWRSEGAGKQPWLISNADGAFAVAALWDVWCGDGGELLSCTLVTTAAAPAFKPWHRRMPVVLTAQEQARWLDNSQQIAADDALFRPELKTDWRLAPLRAQVSHTRKRSQAALRESGEAITLRCTGHEGGTNA